MVIAAATAAKRVGEALRQLGEEGGRVPEHLEYAARLRLRYPGIRLEELGARADPPLTKDAIAGRIRRLLIMAGQVSGSRSGDARDAVVRGLAGEG